MATNQSGQYQADIEGFIADEVLPLAQRQLVIYQFGDPLTLPKGRGLSYTATRFNRLPLPSSPLAENVQPSGETMTISQITATAQQWGDLVRITDIAELTIKHPLMDQANFLIGLQIAETFERNTFNTLMGLTQVNYVNSRGSRVLLTAGDVLDPHTVNRTVVALKDLGAPQFNGQMATDEKREADADRNPSGNPKTLAHYVAVGSPNVFGDFAENSTVVTAWSYSDINRLYNSEVGTWRSMHFCETNMTPSFVGVALVTGTAGLVGSLATSATYNIIVTGSDNQNQYESRIYQVSGNISVTGPNGSIAVTMPATTGFTYSVYIGTTASPSNLAVCASGPLSGPLAGMATQLAPSAAVVLTGVGVAQTPPAAPTTGVTVFPTFVIGKGAYGQIKLKDVATSWLDKADKSDPLNQQRLIGWSCIYGSIILNNNFACRIESSSAFSSAFG